MLNRLLTLAWTLQCSPGKPNGVLSWLPCCLWADRLCFAGRACSGLAPRRSSSWRRHGRRRGNWTECPVYTAAWPLTTGVTWTACSAVCAWPLQMSRRKWCGRSRAPAEAPTWLRTVVTSMCLSANNPTSFSGQGPNSRCAHSSQSVNDDATFTQHGLGCWRTGEHSAMWRSFLRRAQCECPNLL